MIYFNNTNDKDYQRKLNNLLKEVFLDFQFWYDLNLWDENYESYSIMEQEEIVANICVYKTQVLYRGMQSTALSVGAVATKKEYRGRGYSKILMEHIQKKYEGYPMYLCANEGVIDFYPKFGFRRIYEKLPVYDCDMNHPVSAVKLSYDDAKVLNYINNRVNYSNHLDCINTASINLFHIHWGYLKDSIYELPGLDTMVIAQKKASTLKLIGVFSLKKISFSELYHALPFQDIKRIEFGFMPYWSDVSYRMEEYETDPLFVRGVNCDIGDFKFPELSIT